MYLLEFHIISMNKNRETVVYKRLIFSSDLNVPHCSSRICKEAEILLFYFYENVEKRKKGLKKVSPTPTYLKWLISDCTLSYIVFSTFGHHSVFY